MKRLAPPFTSHALCAAKPIALLVFAALNAMPARAEDAVPAATQSQPAAAPASVKPAAADTFDPAFFGMKPSGKNLDLSRFSQANPIFPGAYRADVYANQAWVGRRDVVVKLVDGKPRLCMSRMLMDESGVDYAKLEDKTVAQKAASGDCYEIGQLVPGAQASFDAAELRLDLSIPQLYQRAHARGYVDPQYWDAGAPLAGFLSYNANAYRADGNDTYYLSVNSGLNVGDWRLRYASSLNKLTGAISSKTYQGQYAYAQHDLTDWRAQLTLGDYYTLSDLFSSVSFRGVMIASDDRMLPETQTGYAPLVRGVAQSNARVSIRQGGNVIYETTVPPGEFKIDDLYNTGYAGDLNVTVTEADGSEKHFVVPYAAVPQLLRPGMHRFGLVAAQLRDASLRKEPSFTQGTYQYGLNNSVTLYGGAQLASHYQALDVGGAVNLGEVGALALDATASRASDLPTASAGDSEQSGRSYRITYSKLVEATRTNFTMAAYRYSTAGYLELSDYARLADGQAQSARPRSRFQLNVNQPLPGKWGALFMSGSAQNYWNGAGSSVTYQAGYSNQFSWGSMLLSAGRTRDALGVEHTQYTLSVSVPLGKGKHAPLLTANYIDGKDQGSSVQATLSGTAGDDNAWSYNIFDNEQRASNGGRQNGYGANVTYNNSVASITAGASRSGSVTQESLGVNGALVFHPGGITAAQSLGDTIAVVEAKGAEGASLVENGTVKVNGSGYAVVSSLMPYRLNEVSLNPQGMALDAELQTTANQVAPRAGAIMLMKFPVSIGRPALVLVKMENGDEAPVGASVQDAQGQELTMLGQGGWTFLRGQEGKNLQVSWGDQAAQRCRFRYQLPAGAASGNAGAAYVHAEAVCQREALP